MKHYRAFFHSDDTATIYPEDEGSFAGAFGVVAIVLILGSFFIDFLSAMLPYCILICIAKRIKIEGRGAMILAVGTTVYMAVNFILSLLVIFAYRANYLGLFLMQIMGICFASYAKHFAVKKGKWARKMEELSKESQHHRSDLCEKAEKISIITIWSAVVCFVALIVCSVLASVMGHIS